MTDKLAGRRAVISGGSRGIGAEVAVLFASNGADIALCHHQDEDNARQTVRRIEAAGRRVLSAECDVADSAAVAAFAGRVEREMGDVDIVVNCAGIAGDVAFEALTPDVWTRMMSINLTGTYLFTHAFYPGMQKRGYGRVINFASQLAYKGARALHTTARPRPASSASRGHSPTRPSSMGSTSTPSHRARSTPTCCAVCRTSGAR